MRGYPRWFSATLVHVLILFLFITGALLIPTVLNARFEWDVAWRVGSDGRLWVTGLHVLFAFAALTIVGALWSIHMRYWWRKNLGRKSGLLVLGLLGVLSLSSLGVLYSGSEWLTQYSSAVHSLLGLAFLVPYLWHAVIAKSWRENPR